MGDSSVSCNLSGITLQGEPAVFLPLTKQPYWDSTIEGNRMTPMGAPSLVLFAPLTLPIHCHVDDCGLAVKVVEDENTCCIQQVYGSLPTFLEECCYGPRYGCWFHPAIYQRFSRPVVQGEHPYRYENPLTCIRRDVSELGSRLTHSELYLSGLSYLYPYTPMGAPLLSAYLPYLQDERLLPRLLELYYLIWSMNYANRHLTPTIVGTQYPEHDATYAITRYVNLIAHQRYLSMEE